MNRRRANHNSTSETPISLFPFLAVLICTMGVLILLLVILVRQARLKAVAQARAQTGVAAEGNEAHPIPDESELQRWEEDLAWQEEQLRLARERTQSQLTEARLILGHIEDSIRRLRGELNVLQERLQRFDDSTAATEGPTISELQRRLQQIQDKALNLKAEFETRERDKQRKSYAIIPYQGKFGTTRRPIYLECRGDGVFLQPEGIRFSVEDFLGPLGPGNPLDAALRAIREELLARRELDPSSDGEPYPLLIVRPDGIEAYYAARAAMTSWGTEFGYELVEQEWELTYPARDPKLAEIVQQAVDLARRRQAFLVKAAPGKYGRSSRQYRAAPYVGGAVTAGQEDASGEDPMLAQWRAREQALRSSTGQESGSTEAKGPSQQGLPSGTAATSRGDSPDTNRQTVDPTKGLASGQLQEKGGGLSNSTRQAAESNFDMMRPQTMVGHQVSASGTSTVNSSTGSVRSTENVHPLAEQRGRNWGLPAHERSAIPVTRPIRIDCFPDRLVLVPEKGLDGIRVFYLAPSPQEAVEGLVKAIGEYVETWGIAGRGMYWRPVLTVRVAAGAERQFQILQILLKDSGLEVEQTR